MTLLHKVDTKTYLKL